MLLVRTIILKLLLTICSAFVLDADVITLTVSKRDRSGTPTTTPVWLTENRPFQFHIESDAKIEDFWCSFGGKSKMQRVSETEAGFYAPHETIKTIAKMKGTWKCRVYFKDKEGYKNRGKDINIEIEIKVEIDVDECKATPYPCSENANCTNTFGSYKCTCPSGFTGDGINYCQAMDECQYKPCNTNAECVNTYPGYRCNCRSGFTGDGYGSCHDVDECLYNLCQISLICINTIGGYGCWCPVGYFWNHLLNSCTDIDECRTQTCPGYKTCRNTPGSFSCKCEPGYQENKIGSCEDIDECKLNRYLCKEGERCWNTDGSFKCCPNDKIWHNGNCICPDNYININELGCVYNQCLNTSCGIGAMCNIINAKPQCKCPNGTTGDPHEECAVLAKPGPSQNRGPRESSLEPSIDILLFVSKTNIYDKGLKHITTADELILDEPFTISVSTQNVDFTITEKKTTITCYSKENRKVIHLNKTLGHKTASSKYIAEGLKARASMNGNWACLLKTNTYAEAVKSNGLTKLSSITLEFPVTIVNAPVTERTIKPAFVPADGMIYIELENDNATAKNTTLLLDRPFTIVVNNPSNDVHNITNIKCHYIGNPNEIFTQNQNLIWNKQERVYKAQEGKAIGKMKNKWKCNITYYKKELDAEYYNKKNYLPHHCILYPEVTVKSSEYKKHSDVLVNDVIVHTTPVDEYHAKGIYEYSVGEIVKVSCNKTAASLINMSYFDGDSFAIETKNSSNDVQTIYLKIGERLNKHVLCNVQVNPFINHLQSIRLDFVKKTRQNDLPKINVNGLTLAPALAADGNHYTLFYEYFEREFINCTISNGQSWKTDVELEEEAELLGNGDKLIYSDYAKRKTITFNSNYDSKTLFFNLRPVSNDIVVNIFGLPFSQTHMKYLYNSTTYKTVFLNKNNEILNLTCISPVYTNCWWDQDLTMTSDTTNAFLQNITYLPQEHTSQSTVLKCICLPYIHFTRSHMQSDKKKVHEVTILRDNGIEPSSEIPQGKEEKNKADATTESSLGGGQSGNSIGDNSGDHSTLMLVAIIVVALIVVAAVVWLMVGLYKRRQRREKAMQSEFNYESLENTSERTMPTPAQWDNYSMPVDRQNENDNETYSVPYQEKNVEEMYTKPQPKALRKPPNESLYAEPSYASVEQLGEKATYGNLSNQTAEYSQIQPKKLIGNPNAPKVLPTETPYAEVLPKSMRPNKESSKYANVFDNQRYVNSDKSESSEYAEPAYCEIGFKK